MYTSIDQILDRARQIDKPRVVVVPAADEEHALEAVLKAYNEKIVTPRLIGNPDKISRILKGLGGSQLEQFIIPCDDYDECAQLAVDMCREGDAQMMLKGALQSAQYLKPIIQKETGLRLRGTLSAVAIQSVPRYHKVFATTDSGVVMKPTLEQKKDMIINAVETMRSAGFDSTIKVAVLTAVETVNPKMPETEDAAALKEMNQRGEIPDCIVEGPISFDLAVMPAAVKAKRYESPVAGDADLLVFPELAAANIAGKAMIWADVSSVGIISGASVPIALPSRGSSVKSKYQMLLFCASAVKQ